MLQKSIKTLNWSESLILIFGMIFNIISLFSIAKADDLTDYFNYINTIHQKALGDFISRAQAKVTVLEDASFEICNDYDHTPVGWTNRLLCIVESQVTNGGKVGKYTRRLNDLGITIRAEITQIDQIYLSNGEIGKRYLEMVWICTSRCSNLLNFNRVLWTKFDRTPSGKIAMANIATKPSLAFAGTGDHGLLATLNLLEAPKTLDIKAYIDFPDSDHKGDYDKFTIRVVGSAATSNYQLNLTMNRTKSDGNPGHIKLALANRSTGNFNGDTMTYLEASGGGIPGSKIKAMDAAGTSTIPLTDTSCIKASEILSGFQLTTTNSCGNTTVNAFDVLAENVAYSKISTIVDEFWNSQEFSEHP